MDYKITVAIRTYNEQKHIGEVLFSLSKQTYKNYEVIILDSESTDNTLKIASQFNVHIHHIKKSEFDYSFASNKLVELANGDIVCFLSGHSVPVKETYLYDLNQIFQNSKVGACYGDVIALEDGSIYEKTYNRLGYIKNKLLDKKEEGITLETKIHPGIFSCSNAAARRELLLRHPFAHELRKGGEDIEVAYRIIQDGYSIARVPDLLVKHSHGNGFLKFIKELKSWKVMWKNVLNYISMTEEKNENSNQ